MNNSEKQNRELTTKMLINFFAVLGMFLIIFLFEGNLRAHVQCYPTGKITKGVYSNTWKMFLIIIKVILKIE